MLLVLRSADTRRFSVSPQLWFILQQAKVQIVLQYVTILLCLRNLAYPSGRERAETNTFISPCAHSGASCGCDAWRWDRFYRSFSGTWLLAFCMEGNLQFTQPFLRRALAKPSWYPRGPPERFHSRISSCPILSVRRPPFRPNRRF